MKSTDIFPSKYLRAADLQGKEPTVTIDRVDMEDLGDERKPVVYFVGKDKGLVLNKTNFVAIVGYSGEEDTDDWKGTKVKLVTVKVDFQGKRVPAIRVEEVRPVKVKPLSRHAAADVDPLPASPKTDDENFDDEIPF